jgi:DNA replication and repair protein RecF
VVGELVGGTQIAVELHRGRKRTALLNGASLPRPSDLLGRLPSASFATLDMTVVTGEPAERRLLMDVELCQLSPHYLREFTVYKKVLAQRNALLRYADERGYDPLQLETYDEELADSGAFIRQERLKWVEELAPLAQQAHAELAPGEQLTLTFEPKESDGYSREALMQAFANSRGADLGRGSTNVGPHRDDLAIAVNAKEARIYGSQGQQRTAVISLKVGAMKLATDRLGGPPVLLLDDVFSDLDARRRAALIALTIDQAGQVVLTCTEAEQAGLAGGEDALIYRVESGRISSG